jgi:uncharacterized protein YijF (DUF1287 family)
LIENLALKQILSVLALLLTLTRPTFAQSGSCLVDAARQQVGVTKHYDSRYIKLPYPGGDVAPDRGVCTDVIIRAYRQFGVDLQQLVHEDIRRNGLLYPKQWNLKQPDTNIDHRRVPNLAKFFARHGQILAVNSAAGTYQAGDLVTWRLPAGVPHIGVVSNRLASNGAPLVIHNIGAGTVEENTLFAFVITGHYRYWPKPLTAACKPPDT